MLLMLSLQVAGGNFTPDNTSSTWEVSDVRLVGDQVTLDSALQNSYAEHVLGGKTLPINYNTFITMQQAVSGGNISVNISRAVSRLKTLYFSFYGGDPTAGRDGTVDATAAAAEQKRDITWSRRNVTTAITLCCELITLIESWNTKFR